ncbi:glycosyltransferase [Patescibacteria group bacterium]|nr:glycosyltransferase [Patescibacteria group bacterium]
MNERKKKILFVITKSNWGGAQKYVYDLATNIPSIHYDVAVICGGEGVLVDKLKKENIRVISTNSLKRDVGFFQEFEATRELFDIFKKERPDIVHLNSSKAGGLGALAARITKVKKIIFTAHGWAFNEDRNVVWKTVVYIVSIATSLLSHIVITISHRERVQTIMFPFVSEKKVSMIHIATRSPSFKEKALARAYIIEKSKTKPKKDALWFGSIGELHKNKGYIHALRACVILKNVGVNFFYTIIGEGEEHARLLEFIHKNDLKDRILLAGNIPTQHEGATLLRAFDIFLLPSLKEGLPYVLLEAGCAGLPVIASSVGGVGEIISDQKSGILIKPKDSKALVVAIRLLVSDDSLRAKFGTKLKEKIVTEFSFEHMLEKTVEVYKQ